MNLEKQHIIVTGGNSGIGYYAIEKFLSLGATVVMASRSEKRARESLATLEAKKLPGKVSFVPLDLMSLASVKTFVDKIKNQFTSLNILVNNAGIMFGALQITEDGFESQMATNHFGHFALTAGLMPLLIAGKGRIVNVSSIAHRRGEIDLHNLNYENPKSYSPWGAYSRSKLANLLFTFELDRRLKANATPVTVVAAHPGVSKTNLLIKNKSTQPLYNVLKFLMPLQSAKRGAIPIIEAALNSNCQGNEYFGPSGWFEMGGRSSRRVKTIPLAKDVLLAQQFFDVSETLTKQKFSFKS